MYFRSIASKILLLIFIVWHSLCLPLFAYADLPPEVEPVIEASSEVISPVEELPSESASTTPIDLPENVSTSTTATSSVGSVSAGSVATSTDLSIATSTVTATSTEVALVVPTTTTYVNVEKEAYSLRLPTEPSSPIVLNNLEVRLLGASTSTHFTQLDTSVTYHDVFASTDIMYEINEDNLKESIILKDAAHPISFSYELNLEAYDYRQAAHNEIELYKEGKGGNPLFKQFTLTAPVMIDAGGATSSAITLVLEGDKLSIVPDAAWLAAAAYPVIVDPTIEINVLNVHSHPVQGEHWNVDFTTVGTADLTIAPADQATIDDMQFTSLFCGSEDRTAGVQILPGDVLSYPNWNCDDVATVSHLDLKTGNHHLLFQFAGAEETVTSEAFNAALVWTGLAGDGLYSTAGNWSTVKVPSAADTVTLDDTCTNCNMTIDVSTTTATFTMASNYTGIVTHSADVVFTVSGNFSIAGGTYNGSTNAALESLVINNSFSQTGGVFSAPAGTMKIAGNLSLSSGNFTHNSGTVAIFDPAFLDTTITCTGTPFNKVTLTKGTGNRNITIASGCTVPLGASPTSSITGYDTSAGLINNGTITIASGTWTMTTGNSSYPGNIINNGTITHNGNGWVVAGSLINNSVSSVVTYAGSTLTVQGNLNASNGTFPSGLALTVNDTIANADTTITCGSVTFASVSLTKANAGRSITISSGCTIPLGANPTSSITGYDYTTGLTNNGTITIDSGTWTLTTSNGYPANLVNNGTITHNGTGWLIAGSFINNSVSSVVTYAGSAMSVQGNFNVSNGTFPNGLTVNVSDNGLVNTSQDTVITCGNVTFTKMVLAKASGNRFITISSGCTIPLGADPTTSIAGDGNSVGLTNNGTITIASGTWNLTSPNSAYPPNILNNGTITHSGSGWVSAGGLTMGSSGVVTYNGTAATFEKNFNVSVGTFPNGLDISLVDTDGYDTATLNCGSVVFGDLTLIKDSTADLTIGSDCAVGGDLTVGGAINNPASAKTFTVQGNFSQTTSGTFGGSNLTISLEGSSDTTITKSAGTFASKLKINKDVGKSATLASALAITNTLEITSGTFDQGASYNLTTGGATTVAAAGTWSNTGTGDISLAGDVTNFGTVTLDGSGSGCGGTDAIAISSSASPTQRTWSGSGTFNITDVSVSDMAGSITVRSSTNTSNNSWTFAGCNNSPDAPSALSPSDGSTTSDNTPTLTFTLSDTDGSDTVRYHLLIDDSSDFASPVVSTTSALQAQGSASFTPSSSLADGSYYWRVSASDDSGAASATTTANSGGIAFVVDTSVPAVAPTNAANSSGSSSGRAPNSTSQGGGGSTVGYSILVNYGSATTTTSSVALALAAPLGTTKVRLSNSPDFATTTTFDFANLLAWDLCDKVVCQPGVYTVYAKFYDYLGNPSLISSDTIYLSQKAKEKPAKTAPLSVVLVGSLDGVNYAGSIGPLWGESGLVYLQASVSGQGTAKGKNKLTYLFDCQNDSVIDYRVADTPKSSVKTGPLCRYGTPGDHYASVQVLSSDPAVSDKMLIRIYLAPSPETPTPAYATSTPPEPVAASPDQFTPTSTPVQEPLEPVQTETAPALSLTEEVAAIDSAAGFIKHSVSSIPRAVIERVKEVAPKVVETVVEASHSPTTVLGLGTFSFVPVMLVIQYPVSVGNAALAVRSLSDAYLVLLQFVQGLLASIGLRKRRRFWGTVYDALTKQPIDPAIVELVDAVTGEVVEQCITDLYGRFGFLDKPGAYIIRAKKTHYIFPSKIVVGDSDGIYENVYHGGSLVLQGGGVLVPNIPMDPLARDWNQEEKIRKGITIKFRLHTSILSVLRTLFWFGFALMFLFLVINPTKLNAIVALLYTLLALVNRSLPSPRLWGRVTASARAPYIVEVSYPDLPAVIVGKAYTNSEGRFFLKANPGTYQIKVRSVENPEQVIYEGQAEAGKEGTIKSDIYIK